NPLPTSVMNSRRLAAAPQTQPPLYHADGAWCITANLVERVVMSALCQIATFCAAVQNCLFDHLVRSHEQWLRHSDTECPGGSEINNEIECSGRHDGQVRRPRPFKYFRRVGTNLAIQCRAVRSIAKETTDIGVLPV